MKNNLHYIALILCLILSMASVQGQKDIHIKISGISCDSVKIQSFNWKKRSGTNLVQPYSNEVVFKDKQSLKPGMYWITTDTTQQALFIVSASKKQKLSMTLTEQTLSFDNSPENNAYLEYVEKMKDFDNQIGALNQRFQSSQNLPQYMLRTLADSLTAQAHRIEKERAAYEQAQIEKNPKSLLATIICINKSIPEMPAQYYGNSKMAQQHIISHFFDNFPWNDPRLFNTPIAENKFKEYCNLIYQWDRPDLDTFVVQALQAAKINDSSYLHLFDRLEWDLGYYMSNYKVEHTYIKMLQEILTCPWIEQKRKLYYEHELATINKNLDGDIATDFRFVNEHGDTTSLHAFQSEYTLLFLHNPTCHTCQQVRKTIANFSELNKAIASGKLNVLTIYVENDKNVWKKYLSGEAAPNYHHGWNFDQSIENQDLYETRTIPYMFLLDKDKRVIRKNILYFELEDYIKRLKINN